jgi:quercetin dioxygenase-like cupin family protein
MRFLQLATGASLVFCGALTARLIMVEQSASSTNPTPLILEANDGERREFRTRPGVTFTVKVDPENGGSEQMTVVTEDMAPGDKIPVHRHPHADELILIQSGTGKVTLGDRVQFAHAGAIVFIPRGTWIGMENVGNDRLKHIDVWSAPGFQQYMRSISVPMGQPVVPLSKAEVEELRKRYSHFGIYQ